jgi:hypothetical protein
MRTRRAGSFQSEVCGRMRGVLLLYPVEVAYALVAFVTLMTFPHSLQT